MISSIRTCVSKHHKQSLLGSCASQTNYGALEAALDFPQASVRQRASRVLHLLGIESGATEASTRAAEKLPAAPVPDLLGGLTEDPPAAQDKAQPSANGDMLGIASIQGIPHSCILVRETISLAMLWWPLTIEITKMACPMANALQFMLLRTLFPCQASKRTSSVTCDQI